MLASIRSEYARYRSLAEKSLAQVTDEQFFARPGPESNPIAALVKHVGGNLRSRFTAFLTEDGEKPWRNRDDEFEVDGQSRAELMATWEQGWSALVAALDEVEALGAAGLERQVVIRGQPWTVIEALHRSLAHTSMHVGQVVWVAKHLVGETWQTLSIARGGSRDYNARPDRERG